MKAVWRYEVPVDDQWHEIPLTGDPRAAAMASGPNVEFWAEHTDEPELVRRFRIFGTGHPEPDGAILWAVCPRWSGLVFHLYEGTS